MAPYSPVPYFDRSVRAPPSIWTHRTNNVNHGNAEDHHLPGPSSYRKFNRDSVWNLLSTQEKRWIYGLCLICLILCGWLVIGVPVVSHHNVIQAENRILAANAQAAQNARGSSSSSTFTSASKTPAVVTGSAASSNSINGLAQTASGSITRPTPAPSPSSPNLTTSIPTISWNLPGLLGTPYTPPVRPSKRLRSTAAPKPQLPARPMKKGPWRNVGPMKAAVESARSAAETGGSGQVRSSIDGRSIGTGLENRLKERKPGPTLGMMRRRNRR